MQGTPIERTVEEIVERHAGRLVPIAGFDELMLQLQEKLALPPLLPQLENVHKQRVAEYQKQFEGLAASLKKRDAAAEARVPARQAAEAAVERLTKEKSWWAWVLKARAESDLDKRVEIYRAALEDFPESSELANNYGVQLEYRKDYGGAEAMYRRAIRLNERNDNAVGNLANLLTNLAKDDAEAEWWYRRAFAVNPDHCNNANYYAQFLFACGRFEEATEWTARAWFLPDHRRDVTLAELAFTRWLLDRIAGRDGADALGRLKQLLTGGFERVPVTFDRMLSAALPRLSEDDRGFARKLAAAINDKAKVVELEREPLWRATKAGALDKPWA